jgi:hypothetical protein
MVLPIGETHVKYELQSAYIQPRKSSDRPNKHPLTKNVGISTDSNSHCSSVKSVGYDLDMDQVTLSPFYLLKEISLLELFLTFQTSS